MKRGQLNLIILMAIILFLGILILTLGLIRAEEIKYNLEDPGTWFSSNENFDLFKKSLNDLSQLTEINSVLESANSEQREFIFNNIMRKIKGSKIILSGFENPELKFAKSEDKQILVTNGNAFVNLAGFHKELEKIEYKEKKFIYKFSSGREVVLERGSIDKDGNYIDEELNKDNPSRKIGFLLPEKNSKITVGKDGGFKLENGATVKIGDRNFISHEKEKGEAYVKMIDGGHFITKNLKIETSKADINIPNGEVGTDVFFRKPKPNEKTGQGVFIFESKGGETGVEKKLNIKMYGKDIDVDFSKIENLAKQNVVTGNGENLNVKFSDKISVKIDGKETLFSSNPKLDGLREAFVVINEQAKGFERVQIFGGEGVEGSGGGGGGEITPVEEEKPVEGTKPEEPAPAGATVTVGDDSRTRISGKSGSERVCVGSCLRKKLGVGETAKLQMELNPNQIAELPPKLSETEFYKEISSDAFDKTFKMQILLEKVPLYRAKYFGDELDLAAAKTKDGFVSVAQVRRDMKAESNAAVTARKISSAEESIFNKMVDETVEKIKFSDLPRGSTLNFNVQYGEPITAEIFRYNPKNSKWETQKIPVAEKYRTTLGKFLSVPKGSKGLDGKYPPEEWRDAYKIYQKM